jgi:hypothetical protein
MSAYPSDRLLVLSRRRQHPNHMPAHDAQAQATRLHRHIGPVGAAIRLFVGGALVGDIVYGEFATAGHLEPLSWLVGILGFPALVLVWHIWRIRRNPAPFLNTSPLTFVLSLALPLAAYFLGWAVRPLGFTSDATILFIGGSLLLAALRGSPGCEFLALSNWVLRRNDSLACAILTPLDALDQRRPRS